MKKSMPLGPFRTSNEIVNLDDLAARFEAGAEVTPATPRRRRPPEEHARAREGARPRRARAGLTVSVHAVSASARQKIEAAGGTVSLLGERSDDAPADET